MPAAERQAALDRLSGRAPPLPAPVILPNLPARIRHYALVTGRPGAAALPDQALRLSRQEIEAALVGSFTYHPDPAAVIDRVLLATAQMDRHPTGSDMFRMHHETIMRELRQLGLYPVT